MSNVRILQKKIKSLLNEFSKKSSGEKKEVFHQLINKIVVRKDNKLEIHFHGDAPPEFRAKKIPQSGGNKKLFFDENGGQTPLNSHFPFPPSQPISIIEFFSKKKYKDKEFLQQKYCSEGLSIAQISSQVVSSKEAIRSNLKRHKIEIRERGQHHGHPAQLKYGQKMRKGKTVSHLGEEKILALVKELREQGKSYRQIAYWLSSQNISTKNKVKVWHPETIRRIVKQV